MTFYITSLGGWTETLRKEVEKRVNGEITDPINVSLRGPYGAPAQYADAYEHVVLISGRIGATPFVSGCKHVYYRIRALHEQQSENDSEDLELGCPSDEDEEQVGHNVDDEDFTYVHRPKSVRNANQNLTRGINFAFEEGGDLIIYATWDYSKSSSPTSISSTKNAARSPWRALLIAINNESRALGISPVLSHPNLSAGVTPIILIGHEKGLGKRSISLFHISVQPSPEAAVDSYNSRDKHNRSSRSTQPRRFTGTLLNPSVM